jgi:hypothetical protein
VQQNCPEDKQVFDMRKLSILNRFIAVIYLLLVLTLFSAFWWSKNPIQYAYATIFPVAGLIAGIGVILTEKSKESIQLTASIIYYLLAAWLILLFFQIDLFAQTWNWTITFSCLMGLLGMFLQFEQQKNRVLKMIGCILCIFSCVCIFVVLGLSINLPILGTVLTISLILTLTTYIFCVFQK